MDTIFSKHISLITGLAVFTVCGSGLSAQAETMPQQLDQTTPIQEAATTSGPVPGTTVTSANPLNPEPPHTSPLAPTQTDPSSVAQIDIDPGIPTVGGSSYIGIAGNIGLDGETALGDGSFAVISKIGLLNNISVRPSAVLGNNTVFLVPVTFDLSILPLDAFSKALPIAPYLGGGVIIATGDDGDVTPMATAGVDLRLTSQFTATAAVNVGFLDDTDIGLLVGVGYNFF